MKNIVSILFILPFITLFSCSSVKSEFVIIEVAENEAIITEYIGNSSLVRIPSKIGDYKIIGIDCGEAKSLQNRYIEALVIPKTIKYISSGFVTGCIMLKKIKVSPFSKTYCDNKGVLFSKDKSVLISFPPNYYDSILAHSYKVPKGVQKIEKFAFRECNNISQIELPESVKELGEGAFIGCCELQKINLPINLEIIGEACFTNSKITRKQ